MIIGKGDIASILNDREGAIFFASGVSNSSETNELAFKREIAFGFSDNLSQLIKCGFSFNSSIAFGFSDKKFQ